MIRWWALPRREARNRSIRKRSETCEAQLSSLVRPRCVHQIGFNFFRFPAAGPSAQEGTQGCPGAEIVFRTVLSMMPGGMRPAQADLSRLRVRIITGRGNTGKFSRRSPPGRRHSRLGGTWLPSPFATALQTAPPGHFPQITADPKLSVWGCRCFSAWWLRAP